MDNKLLLASTAFALFVICPRMAGMIHLICKNSELPLFKTALIGSIIAIPLILLMVWIFSKFGITGALAFCILTDIASAFMLKSISMKASLETFIIAAFVLIAVKIAPLISNAIIK